MIRGLGVFRVLVLLLIATFVFGCAENRVPKKSNPITADGILPNVFGKDDRKKAPLDKAPYSQIVSIHSEKFLCTGSLVGKYLVLTNAHCVESCYKNGRITCDLDIYAGFENNEYEDKSIAEKVFLGALDYKKTGESDWALLKIKDPLGETRGFFEVVEDLPLRSKDNFDLTLAGYSSDFFEGALMSYQAGCRIREHGDVGMLLHDCDMSQGASGAPIFKCTDEGECRIIALNAAEYTDDDGKTGVVQKYMPNRANLAVRPEQFAKKIHEWRSLYR